MGCGMNGEKIMTDVREFYRNQAEVVRNATHPVIAAALAISHREQDEARAELDAALALVDGLTGKGSRAAKAAARKAAYETYNFKIDQSGEKYAAAVGE